MSPNQGYSTGGTAITITGTGFVAGATVTVGGATATNVVVVSATSITATTPAGTVGAADVVVTNPDTTSATDAGAFTYLQPQADLTVTAAGPATAIAGRPERVRLRLHGHEQRALRQHRRVYPDRCASRGAHLLVGRKHAPGTSASGQAVTYATAAGLASGARPPSPSTSPQPPPGQRNDALQLRHRGDVTARPTRRPETTPRTPSPPPSSGTWISGSA